MRKLHCLLMGIPLLVGHGLLAQSIKVTDKVTDPTGSPIPNASIWRLSSFFRLPGRNGNTQKLIMHCQAAPGCFQDSLIKTV